MQICSQQQAREAEKEEERREFEAGIAAEKNFQDKIQEILSTHRDCLGREDLFCIVLPCILATSS